MKWFEQTRTRQNDDDNVVTANRCEFIGFHLKTNYYEWANKGTGLV